jgi:hypothetical protein
MVLRGEFDSNRRVCCVAMERGDFLRTQLIRLRRDDGAGGYFLRISENSRDSPRDALLKKVPRRSLATQLIHKTVEMSCRSDKVYVIGG